MIFRVVKMNASQIFMSRCITCGSCFFFFFFNKFIYLIYLFLAVLGLRFCARAFSSCGERGPLFITVRRPLTVEASRCGAQAPDAQAQQLWLTGLVAPRHVGSSQTRARTRVPCIGRQILNHCATREALDLVNGNSFLINFYVIYIYILYHSKKKAKYIDACPTPGQHYHLLWEQSLEMVAL